MLDSEGWAMIYGGGFSEMVLYSRVNYFLLVFGVFYAGRMTIPACWKLDWPSWNRGQGCGGNRNV